MISNREIVEAVHKARPVFDKIQNLYRQLPETTCACEEPGICCAFLPEMTLMEALQWFLNLADGEHDLIAIAERSGLNFARLEEVVGPCLEAGLVEAVD